MSELENYFDSLGNQTTVQECPRCGSTFAEYRKTSLVGCPVCYRYFRELLIPSIRRVQFTLQHDGKFPASTSLESRSRRRVNLLRQELSVAVVAENFERAAELRDEIKQLTELLEKEASHDR
ncbi:MAG: UvrB/UvrC motif-containing protein [Clostridiaceae bacterium]